MAERKTTSRNPNLDPILAEAYERGCAVREDDGFSTASKVRDLVTRAKAAGVQNLLLIDAAYGEGREVAFAELRRELKAREHAAYQAEIDAGHGTDAAMAAASAVTRASRI